MNKKGQVDIGMGTLIIMFVAAVVGVTLFVVVAQQTGEVTSTGTLANYTIAAGANDSTYDFADFKSLTGVSITNASDGVVVPASNYSITNNFVADGDLTVRLTVTGKAFENENWNVTATSTQATTYISESGGRAMTLLIPIFFALAIVVAVLAPAVRSRILEMASK